MKRSFIIFLLSISFILVSAFALSSVASAAVKYTDLSQLDDSATYTKEDMLAMYDFGYSVGYKEGLAETGSVSTDNAFSADYVLNTNTKKFHYPDCSSVSDMKAENTSYFSGSRDEAIAQGYKPCGRCKP